MVEAAYNRKLTLHGNGRTKAIRVDFEVSAAAAWQTAAKGKAQLSPGSIVPSHDIRSRLLAQTQFVG